MQSVRKTEKHVHDPSIVILLITQAPFFTQHALLQSPSAIAHMFKTCRIARTDQWGKLCETTEQTVSTCFDSMCILCKRSRCLMHEQVSFICVCKSFFESLHTHAHTHTRWRCYRKWSCVCVFPVHVFSSAPWSISSAADMTGNTPQHR